jgi:hypothetical protein
MHIGDAWAADPGAADLDRLKRGRKGARKSRKSKAAAKPGNQGKSKSPRTQARNYNTDSNTANHYHNGPPGGPSGAVNGGTRFQDESAQSRVSRHMTTSQQLGVQAALSAASIRSFDEGTLVQKWGLQHAGAIHVDHIGSNGRAERLGTTQMPNGRQMQNAGLLAAGNNKADSGPKTRVSKVIGAAAGRISKLFGVGSAALNKVDKRGTETGALGSQQLNFNSRISTIREDGRTTVLQNL